MNKVFMVMPFSDSTCTNAYMNCIKKICDEFKLEIRRADEIFTTNPVYDDIIKEIQDATIIIVDISGKNPNVFYELGMAHTLKQSHTIIITHDTFKEAPFDVTHFRMLQYEDSIIGAQRLEDQLRKTLESLLKDYKSIYREEYNLVAEVLSSAGKRAELVSLIGLSKYQGSPLRSNRLNAEGHDKDGSYSNHSVSIENAMDLFIKMGYVAIENNVVQVTDKGKSFVDLLCESNFVCDMFNDQIFTVGYKNIFERIKEQQIKEKNEKT